MGVIAVTINSNPESIRSGTLVIDDNINDRSTASFTVHTTSSLVIGEEVVITNDGTKVFGGTIQNYKLTLLRGTTTKAYDVECIDYNQIADRRRVAETYESQTAQYIFDDIVTNYLAVEGISMGTSPPITPTLIKANFNYVTAAEAFQYLQQATGLNWNIDYDKNLNIFYREDNVSTGFTDALDNVLDIEVDRSRDSYRNTQYLKCGDGTTAIQTLEKPTPEPDGVSRTFITRFPLAKKPRIFVDSVEVSPSLIGINGVDENLEWYWNKDKKEIVQDDAETVLNTETLEITYQGLIPILITSKNGDEQTARAAIEGGSGIYEHFEKRASIDDREEAITYAGGLLDRFDSIPERLTILTKTYKTAGLIVPVSISDLGINDNYLIEKVSFGENGAYEYYTVTLLSGESLGSWVEFFRKLTLSAEDFIIQENEVVIRVENFSESKSHAGSTNIKTWDALFPANDLYPSDSLYPNNLLVTEVDVSD